MFTEQFERIAREGILKDIIEKMGHDISSVEAKAMLRLNMKLNDILYSKFKDTQPPQDGLEMAVILRECAVQAFDQVANEFRKEGDWEGYGVIMWAKGSMGIK